MKSITLILMILIGGGAGYAIRTLTTDSAPAAPPAAAAGQAAPTAPSVKVLKVEKVLTSPVKEYIAQVHPMESVRLIPQVSGIISAVHFAEGELVEEGELLFSIQPAEYEAQVAQSKAAVARAEATLVRMQKSLSMYTNVDKRSISQYDLDAAEASVAEAEAGVLQAKADLQLAELNLGYTEIKSPITGKIGKTAATVGNYVARGGQALAEIVQVDPIRVVFSMPDSEYLSLMEVLGKSKKAINSAQVKLPNGSLLAELGARDFEDNQMAEGTGSIAVHLRFANEKGLLIPNGLVSVLVRKNLDTKGIMLPQSAVMIDVRGAFVWVLGEGNIAEQKRIELGAMVETRRIVKSGLDEGDVVIVGGLQKVRPGAAVAPEFTEAASQN
ncbi:efflux RND transporter periplasmic adaptor subunit [Persicirhabdus sediminis]|uniref:Efflux RND transporter periplasmic adaptor subunit n=1 Tax=Persicirhabdus sediminis TaxID=454144 RepID=A0A8J7SQ67_9BACT|nr:efflux RND transporter periplasmic adaptor subunit [Persicirhabdus sediminis]MBK1792798.1 efflux RND transporter periplasmic adaptor subunit [Persicirhabdus sediminis]